MSSTTTALMRDRYVIVAVVVAMIAMATTLFAGRYLPYVDWNKHAALIAALANGEDTGTSDYLVRTLRPTPYLLFYVTSAIGALLFDADVGARIVCVLAAGGAVLATADLLTQLDRDRRLCVLGALPMFGIALYYGFGSFLVAIPVLIWFLARLEATIKSDGGGRAPALRPALRPALLSLALVLLLLAHGLALLAGAIAALSRVALSVRSLRTVGLLALAVVPALMIAIPMALRPRVANESIPMLYEVVSLREHWVWLTRGLITKDVPGEQLVLIALAIAAVALVAVGFRRGFSRVLVLYAAFFWIAFWFGPKSLGGPFQVYLVYARYAGLALLFTLLVSNLVVTRAMFAAACAGVLAIGALCALPVRNFSALVAAYDDVRAAVPARATVLSIYQPDRDDVLAQHHPAGALHFLHMVDGAAYVGFLFNNSAHPVFHRSDVKLPRPQIGFAKDWSYVVVRGSRPTMAMDNMPDFSLHTQAGGWRVYKRDR